MANHTLSSTPATCHWGYFAPDLKPALEIASGDRVTIETISGAPAVLPHGPGWDVLPEHASVHAECPLPLGNGHILTGPVAVQGAEPGDVLQVDIEQIDLRTNWGWNIIRPLAGALPEDFHETTLLHIPLDKEKREANLPWGTTLPLNPFFGVMGVAPPSEWGMVTSIIPRAMGGNLDCKEIGAGATLYLPVFQPGALFSTGDGHALQGDGEVNVTAIETNLTGHFRLTVRKDMGTLAMPMAETPTHFMTFGIDPDLDNAAKQALRAMIDLICDRRNLSREQAYALCSITCDLRISQIVNQHKGIHAMLPKAAL
ncbi:MAG: acetamidase/formamidase family protein [Alphaproteobacteria bacterium]|jgi:acetamidase/formamidase